MIPGMAFTPAILISPSEFKAALAVVSPKAAQVVSTVLSVSAQGATVEDLLASTTKALADVAALNQRIADVLFPDFGSDYTNFLLVLNDAEFAGAGDGHTFVLNLTFLPAVFSEQFGLTALLTALNAFGTLDPLDLLPDAWAFGFGIAGTGEDVALQYPSAIEQAVKDSEVVSEGVHGIIGFFNMAAGAAKGTRLALCAGGVARESTVPTPTPPIGAARTAPSARTATSAQPANPKATALMDTIDKMIQRAKSRLGST